MGVFLGKALPNPYHIREHSQRDARIFRTLVFKENVEQYFCLLKADAEEEIAFGRLKLWINERRG